MLKEFGRADRLFAPVLVGCTSAGERRIVTFASGLVVRERLIDRDERRYRLCYTLEDGPFEHHSASMQIVPAGAERCRFVWISDFLPHDRSEAVSPLVDEGSRAVMRNIEAEWRSADDGSTS